MWKYISGHSLASYFSDESGHCTCEGKLLETRSTTGSYDYVIPYQTTSETGRVCGWACGAFASDVCNAREPCREMLCSDWRRETANALNVPAVVTSPSTSYQTATPLEIRVDLQSGVPTFSITNVIAGLIISSLKFLSVHYGFISWFCVLCALCVYSASAMMLCPVPEPCHCIGNDIIYCAYQRLDGLPYFLDFFEVWDKMNLSDNLIKGIPEDGFDSIRIRNLDLSRNLIGKLQANAFRGIMDLEGLDVSHNQLRSIPRAVFRPLFDLKVLRLRYNRFRGVNADAFVELTSLEELDLSGNELSAVPSSALAPLKSLRKLWLRNNRLKGIAAFAFPEIPLEFLDLGDNAAPMRMDSEALCGLRPSVSHAAPNVKEWSGMHTLLMDHNGISHLDACVVKLIWTLQKIDISGNPLRCDCRLYFLKLWGTRTTFPSAQCAEPYRYAGEYFDHLETHTFNCSQRDVVRNCDSLCHIRPETEDTISGAIQCEVKSLLVLFFIALCVVLEH